MNRAPSKPGGDGEEQRRLLLAVALCGGILVVWSWLFPHEPPAQTIAPDAGVATEQNPTPEADPQTAAATPVTIERKVLATLGNSEGRSELELVNDGGQIGAWTLNEDQYGVGEKRDAFRFVAPMTAEHNHGVFLPPELDLNLAGQATRGDYTLGRSTEGQAELNWTDPTTGIAVKRTYTLDPKDYTVKVAITLTNGGAEPVKFGLNAHLRGAQNDKEATGSMFSPPIYLFEAVCEWGENFERMPVGNVAEAKADGDPTRFSDDVRWAGVDNRYFMTAVLPEAGDAVSCAFASGAQAVGVVEPDADFPISYLSTRVELKGGELTPGASVTRTVTFYGGPKKLNVLANEAPPLSAAIDFGIFTVICTPLLWLMRTFFGFVGNWGFAIILLTLFVKLLTFPLTHKQYKSMAAMKVLQPQLKVLQEKYKDDKAKLQQEMMKLYKENGANPLAGCLPMILMMPIYFSLYRTIYSAVELYQAPFIFWIKDLSAQDPTYVLPILLGVLMVAQMRLNPSAGGDQLQQKIIMWVMPIMFSAMMLFLPSGLVVYILINTILGIVQQMYLLKNAAAPAPGLAKAGAKA